MTTETTELRGKELFNAVLAHLEANPQIHSQETYGERNDDVIVGCLALWTVVLADGKDVLTWWDVEGGYAEVDCVQLDPDDDGNVTSVGNRAQELLGVEWSERRLFYGNHTLDDLRRIGAEIWPDAPATPAA